MANNTPEFWSIDGVSLHQYGWSVDTIGGSRYDLPPRRGDNIQFAYRPGAVHRAKLAGSRTIDLLMWMVGADPATGIPGDNQRLAWHDNWDFLRRLVWKPNGAQVLLTRRSRLTIDGVPAILEADALAEVADTMEPRMTGGTRATFSMTLLMADPYFYGTEITTTMAVDEMTTVDNPGHDTASHANLVIDLIGPLVWPRLTNSTPSPDVWVQYSGTIADGETLRLDVGEFTATRLSDEANLIGAISNSGGRHWMGLVNGTNDLTLTGSGGGSAELRFRPPYV